MKKRFLACGLCALMLLSAVRASAVRGEDVFQFARVPLVGKLRLRIHKIADFLL